MNSQLIVMNINKKILGTQYSVESSRNTHGHILFSYKSLLIPCESVTRCQWGGGALTTNNSSCCKCAALFYNVFSYTLFRSQIHFSYLKVTSHGRDKRTVRNKVERHFLIGFHIKIKLFYYVIS